MSPETSRELEEYREELAKRPIHSIRDVIEKDVGLADSPHSRKIDAVFLADGSSIPGALLSHCFPEVLMAQNGVTGETTYIPYAAIAKVTLSPKS